MVHLKSSQGVPGRIEYDHVVTCSLFITVHRYIPEGRTKVLQLPAGVASPDDRPYISAVCTRLRYHGARGEGVADQ